MYRAPLREMRFVLEELLGSATLAASPHLADYSDELARSVLEEAARFAENVLEPLNRPGDVAGARWTEQGVLTRAGVCRGLSPVRRPAAGRRSGGPPDFGGQPVPRVLVTAVSEFWGSANLAFKLCPMLTQGAAHALELCGSPAQKALLSAQAGERGVDRHHGAHRAAGRVGSGTGAHARRAGGRSLPPVRAEDLHHLGRPRPHAQHAPHAARAHRRRARRGQGHLAVHRAQVPGQPGRHARRTQRGALPVHRAQARHPREPHLRAGVRRAATARSRT